MLPGRGSGMAGSAEVPAGGFYRSRIHIRSKCVRMWRRGRDDGGLATLGVSWGWRRVVFHVALRRSSGTGWGWDYGVCFGDDGGWFLHWPFDWLRDRYAGVIQYSRKFLCQLLHIPNQVRDDALVLGMTEVGFCTALREPQGPDFVCTREDSVWGWWWLVSARPVDWLRDRCSGGLGVDGGAGWLFLYWMEEVAD